MDRQRTTRTHTRSLPNMLQPETFLSVAANQPDEARATAAAQHLLEQRGVPYLKWINKVRQDLLATSSKRMMSERTNQPTKQANKQTSKQTTDTLLDKRLSMECARILTKVKGCVDGFHLLGGFLRLIAVCSCLLLCVHSHKKRAIA